MADSPLILTEWSSLDDLQAPLKRSARLKYNCISVSSRLIALGSNTGGVYLFSREGLQLLQIVFADKETASVSMVSLSPNEKFVALVVSTGAIHVVDLRLESRSKPETVKSTSDLGAMPMTLYWHSASTKLYIGDDMGKVSMVPVSSNKAKNLFTSPLEVLLKLDSCIMQIDGADDKLLVSTVTRCYLCDTLRENYSQIGEKLRNGHFGACFLKQRSVSPTVYCARPGSRIWEVDFGGVVLNTHQFKQLLAVPPLPIVTDDSTFDVPITDDRFPAQAVAFPKLHVLRKSMLVSWTSSCIYVLDPVNIKVILWCNTFSDIQDICCLGNELYIFLPTMKVHRLSLTPVVEVISICLKSENFVSAANMCIYFETVFLHKYIRKLINITELYHLYDKLSDTNRTELANRINSVIVTMETKMASGSETESIASSRSRSGSSVSRQSSEVLSFVAMETVVNGDEIVINESGLNSSEHIDTVIQATIDADAIVENFSRINTTDTNGENIFVASEPITILDEKSSVVFDTERVGIDIPDGGNKQLNLLDRGVPDGNSFVEPSSIESETGDNESSQNDTPPHISINDPNSDQSENAHVEHINVELNSTVTGENQYRDCDNISAEITESDGTLEGENELEVNNTAVVASTDLVHAAAELVEDMVTQNIDTGRDLMVKEENTLYVSKEFINEEDASISEEVLSIDGPNVVHADNDCIQVEVVMVNEYELDAAIPHKETSFDEFETVNLDSVIVVDKLENENCGNSLPIETFQEDSAVKNSVTSIDEQSGIQTNEIVFKIGEENHSIGKKHDNMTLNLQSAPNCEAKNITNHSDLMENKNGQYLTLGHVLYGRSPSPLSPSPVAMAMKHDVDVTMDVDLDLEFYQSKGLGSRRPSLTSLSSYDSAEINMDQATWNDGVDHGSEEIARRVKRKSSRKKHRRSLDDPAAGKNTESSYRRSYSVGAIQPLAAGHTQPTQGTIEEDCHAVSRTRTDTLEQQAVTQSVPTQFSRSVPNFADYEKKQDGHLSTAAPTILSTSGDTALEQSGDYGRGVGVSPADSPLSASWEGDRVFGTSPTSRSTLVQLKNRVKTKVKSQTQQLVKNIKDKNLLSRAKEFAGNRPQTQEGPHWLANGEPSTQETESSKPLFTLGIMPLRLVDIERLKEVTSTTEKKLQDLSVLMDPEAVYKTLLDWVTALNETFRKLHSIKYVKSEQDLDDKRSNENGGDVSVGNEVGDIHAESSGLLEDGEQDVDKLNTSDNRTQPEHGKENFGGLARGVLVDNGDSNEAIENEFVSTQSPSVDILNDRDFCYNKDPIFLPPDVFNSVSELAQACFDLGCHGNILKYRYMNCETLQKAQNDNLQCDSSVNDCETEIDIENKGCSEQISSVQVCDMVNIGTKEATDQNCDLDTTDSVRELLLSTEVSDSMTKLVTNCEKGRSEITDSNNGLDVCSETMNDNTIQLSDFSSQKDIVLQSINHQSATSHVTSNDKIGNIRTEIIIEKGTNITNEQTSNAHIPLDKSQSVKLPCNEDESTDKTSIVTDSCEHIHSHVTIIPDCNASHQETDEEEATCELSRLVEDHICDKPRYSHKPDAHRKANFERHSTDDDLEHVESTKDAQHLSESCDMNTVEQLFANQSANRSGCLQNKDKSDEQLEVCQENEDTAMAFYVRCYFPYLSITRIRKWTLTGRDGDCRYQTWSALLASMEAMVSEDGEKYGVDDSSVISHVLESCTADNNGSRLLGLVSRIFPSSRKIIDVCVQCHPYILPLDVLYLCKYHCVAMETVFKQYMLQMIESALRTHRKDTLSSLYVHDEVRHTWLELLLAEHVMSTTDDQGRPRLMDHIAQWTNGSRIDEILDLPVSQTAVGNMLELCQKYGYWKGSLRLLRLLDRRRDHLDLILHLGDINLLNDSHLTGYLPKDVTEWEELLEAFTTYQKSKNQAHNDPESDWPASITWDSLALLLVQHLGPDRAVSLLQSCDVLETFSATFYQKCLLSGIVQKQQRLVLHSMLEKVDTYLWSQRPGVLSPQLHYAAVKEKELAGEPSNSRQEPLAALVSQLRSEADSAIPQYVEDPECHWGVTTNINTMCPCCGIALKDPVSHVEPGVLLFRCGHGFHKLCLPDRECFLCGSEPGVVLPRVTA